jgi:hypothetical protein
MVVLAVSATDRSLVGICMKGLVCLIYFAGLVSQVYGFLV